MYLTEKYPTELLSRRYMNENESELKANELRMN
jgi:hypothetical protein